MTREEILVEIDRLHDEAEDLAESARKMEGRGQSHTASDLRDLATANVKQAARLRAQIGDDE